MRIKMILCKVLCEFFLNENMIINAYKVRLWEIFKILYLKLLPNSRTP